VESTLQDALKVQSNLFPWRKAVEQHHTKDGAHDFVLPPGFMQLVAVVNIRNQKYHKIYPTHKGQMYGSVWGLPTIMLS